MCEYRKQHMRRLWPALLTRLLTWFRILHLEWLPGMLLCVTAMAVFPLSGSAAGSASVTATIPVTVVVSGDEEAVSDAQEESYTILLTAQGNAPMPESDTRIITGSGSAEFLIEYDSVGTYCYIVTQKSEVSVSDGGSTKGTVRSYDDTVYYVTVIIQNTEDGGIGAIVVAYKDRTDGDKCEILFENMVTSDTADTEAPPETEEASNDTDPPQTGDDTPVLFWLVLMAAGGVSFWLTFRSFLRTAKRNNHEGL